MDHTYIKQYIDSEGGCIWIQRYENGHERQVAYNRPALFLWLQDNTPEERPYILPSPPRLEDVQAEKIKQIEKECTDRIGVLFNTVNEISLLSSYSFQLAKAVKFLKRKIVDDENIPEEIDDIENLGNAALELRERQDELIEYIKTITTVAEVISVEWETEIPV